MHHPYGLSTITYHLDAMRCDLTLVQARAQHGLLPSAWGGVLSFFHSSPWLFERATLHFAFIGPFRASITGSLILFLCFSCFACCWTTGPFSLFCCHEFYANAGYDCMGKQNRRHHRPRGLERAGLFGFLYTFHRSALCALGSSFSVSAAQCL